MESRTTRGLVLATTLVAGGGVLAGTTGTAVAATSHQKAQPGVRVIASGLSDPQGLYASRRGFLVAETGAAKATAVSRSGHKRISLDDVNGISGVAYGWRHGFAVTGGGDETGQAPPGNYPAASVLRWSRNGKHVKPIADLLAYEKKHNPDHQPFVDENGKPYDDALSNPFSVTYSKRFGLLVADGGANDVLRVNPRTGHISTFFVPRNVTDVPACQGPDANVQPVKGCDTVPTGVAVVGRYVYVSTLGADRPDAARIYKLNGHTRKIVRVWKGFTGLTGVAVNSHGTIVASQVAYNFPEGDPGPGFDPSTVGRLIKVRHGKRTVASVTMPVGVRFVDGRLYSTAWSVGSFVGMPTAGQIVRVRAAAFHPEESSDG